MKSDGAFTEVVINEKPRLAISDDSLPGSIADGQPVAFCYLKTVFRYFK